MDLALKLNTKLFFKHKRYNTISNVFKKKHFKNKKMFQKKKK